MRRTFLLLLRLLLLLLVFSNKTILRVVPTRRVIRCRVVARMDDNLVKKKNTDQRMKKNFAKNRGEDINWRKKKGKKLRNFARSNIQGKRAFLLGHFLCSIHIHTLHPSSTASPPCYIPSPLYFPFPGPFSFHGRTINSRGHWYAIDVLASLPLLSWCARLCRQRPIEATLLKNLLQ